MFAATNETGTCFAFPDVCNTPMPPIGTPAPMPYPNSAETTQANPATCAEKVSITGAKAVTVKTVIPLSEGDEPGVAMGVVSGMIMGPVGFISGSACVFIEGSPAVMLGATTRQNGTAPNCEGSLISPSQTVVSILR